MSCLKKENSYVRIYPSSPNLRVLGGLLPDIAGQLVPTQQMATRWCTSYDEILKDELALEQAEADEKDRKYIYSKNPDQQLDEEQRRFIWIMSRVFTRRKFQMTDVETYNESFFWRDDHSNSNPYNNWFLQFPEWCPSFLFHQFVTTTGTRDLFGVSN